MNTPEAAKVLVIDSNVYFTKKIREALRREGFEVLHTPQAAYALTMLEWNRPAAILCATNLREMGAWEIARILRADPKTANIPIIAVGSGGEHPLLQAFRAGCDDYVDRRRDAAEIACHVRTFLTSRQDGFQPMQMLSSAETVMSGRLSHMDLAGVIQMLAGSSSTGALHIHAKDTEGVLFLESGVLRHAECAALSGDQAVMHLVKACHTAGGGDYKFVEGPPPAQAGVTRSATDLLLDAMRELDEAARDAGTAAPGEGAGQSDEGAGEAETRAGIVQQG